MFFYETSIKMVQNQTNNYSILFDLETEVQDLLSKISNVLNDNIQLLKELIEITAEEEEFVKVINSVTDQFYELKSKCDIKEIEEKQKEQSVAIIELSADSSDE